MPRNGSGVYTLPPSNPVAPGTVIESAWANDTMDDIASALTDSLSRTGSGGMSVPLKFADGAVGAPGMSWVNEPTSGWYRSALNSFWYSVGNENIFRITKSGVELAAGKTATGFDSLVIVDDADPSPVSDGAQWFESDTGALYMRYQNPDLTYTWIQTNPAAMIGDGLPVGGTAGQALTKIDSTDFNTEWTTLGAGTGTVTSVSVAIADDDTVTESGSPIVNSGTITLTAVDAGADKLKGWDDSAGKVIYFDIGAGLTITGTTLSFSGIAGHAIEDEGVPVAQQATMNFVGAGVTVTDAGGKTVVTIGGGTSPATGFTLDENASIGLDPTLSADGKYTGITMTGTLGETVAFGEMVYLKAADSKWWKTDADVTATAGGVACLCCVEAGVANDVRILLVDGNVRADAIFPALTIGAPVFLSTTAGAVQVAAPAVAGNIVRIVGHALTADSILFRADHTYIEV